ncbi:MAG: N-glycosylase/DNA lyase [Candidatus Helarchaeota archaeon]|nr:N-glycosylase/DNA lyase [Candidatus Helarchaeota archaeon]
MQNLLEFIQELKQSKIKDLVDNRIKEFKEVGEKKSNEIFKELCFCIMTANCSAEMCIRVQDEIDDGFLTLQEVDLAKRLKEVGYRFYNKRANYIEVSRKYKDDIKEIVESYEKESELRDWLVKNIKGLGYKEASHFLRNIGFKGLAIIDFHIIDLLIKQKLIDKKPKSLSKTKYLEIESILKKIAEELNLTLGELDLYLWYMETGKILK